MDQEAAYKSVVAGTGIVGSVVVFVLLVLGPMTATPTPSGLVLAVMIAYPVLLFATAFAGMRNMRAAQVLSMIAIGCALIALVPMSADEGVSTVIWMVLIVCSPAIAQVVTTRGALREEKKADEAWRVSRGFQSPDPANDSGRD